MTGCGQRCNTGCLNNAYPLSSSFTVLCIGIGIGIVLLETQQADLPNYRESHVQKVTRMKKRKKQNRKD